MDNLIKKSGKTLITETVTQTISLVGNATNVAVPITFSNLTEILGVISIKKLTTGNTYYKYPALVGRNNTQEATCVEISNNSLILHLDSNVEVASESNWEITAIGY